LRWLTQGKTHKEISVILQVSEATVRTHLEHLYAKLGVANKVDAASIALWQQLAESLTSMMSGLSWQTRFGWTFLSDAFQIENRNV
jgi:ATP/maltotriose-dependent transcriptional regulator MalT